MRIAIVENGTVTTVLIADSLQDVTVEPGQTAMPSDVASPGWIYTNNAFSRPEPVRTKEVLTDIAKAKRDASANAGITIDVGASAVVSADTNAEGKVNLLGLQALAATGAPIVWVQSTGPVTLTSTQVNAIALSVGTYVSLCWGTYGTVAAAIEAGTITTVAQIEAAAWPSTSR